MFNMLLLIRELLYKFKKNDLFKLVKYKTFISKHDAKKPKQNKKKPNKQTKQKHNNNNSQSCCIFHKH